MNTTIEPTSGQQEKSVGVQKRFIQVIVGLLIQAGILFGAAGRLDWGMAWALLGIQIVSFLLTGVVLTRRDPDLVAERAQKGEGVKRWDPPLALFISLVGPVLVWLTAGLDQRFEWTEDLNLLIKLCALLLVALGLGIWSWAMVSNRFFSGLVRIQHDRGHTVATTGPYRFVRHPGYASMILWTLATPLVLNSWWAFVPAGLILVVAIVRTALEDRTLHEELPGYTLYADHVRYRLFPGIW